MSIRISENYNVKMVFIYNKSRAMITCCNGGTATNEQKEMLDNGHWKPKK